MHFPARSFSFRSGCLALVLGLAGPLAAVAQTAPVITTQPQGQSVNLRAPATFTVAATGSAPLFYQWFFNGVLLSTAGANNAQAYLGINTPTLTVISATNDQAGVYTASVSNGTGGVLSNPVTLTVVQVPEVFGAPPSGVYYVGLPFYYQVNASNSPASYQVTGLPPGLAVNATTGVITGMPTAAGIYSGTLTATNALGTSGAVAFSLDIRTLPPTFALIAGGPPGSSDGHPNGAQFNQPGGIARDAAGNLWIADSGNHTIRRMTSTGVVSTIAGLAGQTGPADGLGSAARFNNPTAVAVDAAGNVYIADTDNQLIRKISADTVSTVAGVYGQVGANDGPAASARFSSPRGIAVDAAGNVFVADTGNSTIRQISPAGAVTTLAGAAGLTGANDGPGASARFSSPAALSADPAGNIYVLDRGNFAVRKISATGTVTTVAQNLFQKDPDFLQFPPLPTIPGAKHAANGMAVDAAGNLFLTYGPWGINSVANFSVVEVSAAGTTSNVLTWSDAIGFPSLGPAGMPTGISVAAGGVITIATASSFNTATSGIYVISPAAGPSIITQPQDATAVPGQVVTFGVTAGGLNPPNQTLNYQWLANGSPIPFALNGTAITPFLRVTAGFQNVSYSVMVYTNNPVATIVSNSARLTVTLPPGPAPVIVAQPHDMTIDVNGTTALTVTLSDTAPAAYQWRLNGVDILGANSATLLLKASLPNPFPQSGQYTVTVGRAGGTVTSLPAQVIAGSNLPSRIANLSVRTNLPAGRTMIVGFVTSGPKDLLIRAVGPGLGAVFGLTNFYPDPMFAVYNSTGMIDQDADWSSSLAPTFTSVGAFPLTPGSKDAALVRSITGPNTALVSGTGSGVMLVEMYDAEPLGSGARLTNVSARNQVGTGGDILISGFVIDGTAARTVLVRGIGPGLHDNFGVDGFLPDPVLEIHQTVNNQDTVVATNDNWDASLTAIFDQVGAYHFTPGSKDAALVVTLPPGIYTAQVSGANSTTGDGVVEVYVVP